MDGREDVEGAENVLDGSTSEMAMDNELMKLRFKKSEDKMDLDDCIAGVTVKYDCIIKEKERCKTIVCARKIFMWQ